MTFALFHISQKLRIRLSLIRFSQLLSYLSVHDTFLHTTRNTSLEKVSTREVYKYASTLAKRFARESSDQPPGSSTNLHE